MLKVKNMNEILGNTENELTLINAVKEGNNQLVIMMLDQGVSIETEEKFISYETNENNQSNSLSLEKKEQIEKEINEKLELMDSLEKELSNYQGILNATQKYAKAMAQTPRSGGERRHILLGANTQQMQQMQTAIAATQKKINVQKEEMQKLEQQLALANEVLKQQKPEELNKQKSEVVGNRLLHLAAYYGHKDTVALLVRRGADVTIKNKEGKTPYDIANNVQIRKLLLTLIQSSGNNKNISIITPSQKTMKDNGNFARTELHDAVELGDIAEIRKLVKSGYSLTQRNNNGMNALDMAASLGKVDVIRCLVKDCKANVEETDIQRLGGATALLYASMAGHVDAIRCLVKECNANVNHADIHNRTAVFFAAKAGAVSAVRFLVKECDADVNVAAKIENFDNGNTALHVAVMQGRIDLIECLIKDCNADITIKNKEGKTPYDIANSAHIRKLILSLSQANNNNVSNIDTKQASSSKSTEIKEDVIEAKDSVAERSWHFDKDTKASLNEDNNIYALVPATKKDFDKVLQYYQHHPVPGMDIAKVQVIYNKTFNRAFELRMHALQQRDGNPAFAPKWSKEHAPEWRQKVQNLFENLAAPYVDSNYPAVKLLPLWHGTKASILESLFKAGYANLATTDSGFFGKGIYSTYEAEYAYRVYSYGALILNWVCIFSAYPTIDGDMVKLMEKGNYQNYDAHFIPVIPSSGKFSYTDVNYYPCTPNQPHQYLETVVFDSQQCLPRYLVELQPSLPKEPFHPIKSFEHTMTRDAILHLTKKNMHTKEKGSNQNSETASNINNQITYSSQ